MKKTLSIVLILSLILMSTASLFACTNFLVSKGASKDKSVMITYAADSHVLYGELYFYPAADHLPGSMRPVYEWDTGKYLGEIPEIAHTYRVVGNINQHQVAIGETTWGGLHELRDKEAIVDYGSLIYITLQRAKSAREAIKIMAELVENYGYYSSGESFSIADANEVWILEMISKGTIEKGAVWVARQVPDGYICAHANQARIQTFPLANGKTSITSENLDKIFNDKVTTVYAKDVISFARDNGFYEGSDKEFSFARTYAPADFGALRFCEARVYAFFNRAAPSANLPTDYVAGNVDAEPLPLWIKPDEKLSVHDVMEMMRDHFEGTPFDMTNDLGAGPYRLPYRWRPLTWEVDSIQYFNERAISTQQTGFSFVTQSRSELPDDIGGIIWFGVDDSYSSVYVPMYCSITDVPKSYAVGTGNFDEFSWDSAFWVFNFVSNYAYSRYCDMIKDIQLVQRDLEGSFLAQQKHVDQAALSLYKESPLRAVEYLTDYSVSCGEKTVKRWKKLGEFLIYKYLDGNVKNEHGGVTHPGYPKAWYKAVAKSTGDKLKIK